MFFVRDSSSFQSYTLVFLYRFIAVLPNFKEDTVFDWLNLFALTNTYANCSNDYVPAWSQEQRFIGTYYRFCLRWVCEQEKASQPHYHCWIALPHRSVRWFGTPERGIAGIITEIWMKLTGGKATLVNLSKATKDYPDHYVIHREYPSSLEGPIFWLSYLAKERGKLQTGKGTRMYSTSKLSSKALNSQMSHRKPVERFFFPGRAIPLPIS